MDNVELNVFKLMVNKLDDINKSLTAITSSIDEIAKETKNIKKIAETNERATNMKERSLYFK